VSVEANVATSPITSPSGSARKARRPAGEPAQTPAIPLQRTAGRQARRVALAEIDRSDTRFQYRILVSHGDLIESLRSQGQLNPVILWGDRPPYIIVDGFRRIDAISALGGNSVQGVFLNAKDERAAFAISFAENVRRRSLTAQDKANAIWRAINVWQMDKRDVAASLALSIRQVDRYLKLLEFSPPLLQAVKDGRICMAHAILLDRAKPPDLSEWIDEIAAGNLSAKDLKRRLQPIACRRRPKTYLVQDAKGFRLRQVRYRSDMGKAEKQRIWESLEAALRLIAESS
jgi:ParB/RepB/Spo0J family partition protein